MQLPQQTVREGDSASSPLAHTARYGPRAKERTDQCRLAHPRLTIDPDDPGDTAGRAIKLLAQ